MPDLITTKLNKMKQKAEEIYHRFVNYEWNNVSEGLKKSILEAIETALTEGQKLPMPNVSKRFSVASYSIIDTNGSMYVHWSEGLNMIIEKDGVTMKLNSDEIQQIVKALPRTVGGRY